MRKKDILALQLHGLQSVTAHDIAPAHAYKVLALKRAVRKAHEGIIEEIKELLKSVDLEDYDKDRAQLRDMKKKIDELSSEEKERYDKLASSLERFEKLYDEMTAADCQLEGVKTIPYEVWHQLQVENRSKAVPFGGRVMQGVDILSGEVENILEGVFWTAPEEEI